MATVGAFEAKTHFSRLLERVEGGEEIVITRRGKTVAKLVPAPEGREPEAVLRVFRRLHDRAEWKDYVEAGRRP